MHTIYTIFSRIPVIITSMRSRLPFVVLGLTIGLTFNAVTVLAWAGPTGTAPNSNVTAPVNVGNVDQVKNAGLGVNSMLVTGNALLLGSSAGIGRYLNFDYTSLGTLGTGSAGYGIRDNGSGVLEFKNNGGTWQSLQAIVSSLGSNWLSSGNNIYNANSGN